MTNRNLCYEQLKLRFNDLRMAMMDVKERSEVQAIIAAQGQEHAACPITSVRYKINPNPDLWLNIFNANDAQEQLIAIICPKSHIGMTDGTAYLGVKFSGSLVETETLPSWVK